MRRISARSTSSTVRPTSAAIWPSASTGSAAVVASAAAISSRSGGSGR
ncbi:hypothetical protein [uncultured Sphingomonas sp.]